MALNLSDALWVSCELIQLQQSRGHYYLDLVQKSEDEPSAAQIVARAQAILWQRNHQRLRRKLGRTFDQLLQQGLQLLIQIKVSYHEVYGLQYIVEDIDPAYTLGQLELQRRQSLEQLEKEGLLDKNKSLTLPDVLQRIAVLSSSKAAGLQDFKSQLSDNPFGYTFHLELFATPVQGSRMEEQMMAHIHHIRQNAAQFDCLAVIRGGGSRFDLAAFDSLALNQQLARLPLPIFTGIGHDIDSTIMDRIASQALKTPTAVADFIVHHNMNFEGRLLQSVQQLNLAASHHIRQAELELSRAGQNLQLALRQQLRKEERLLRYVEQELPGYFQRLLKNSHNRLQQLEEVANLMNPEAILRRGYTISTVDGQPLQQAKKLKEGQILKTRFHQGEIESTIKKSKDVR